MIISLAFFLELLNASSPDIIQQLGRIDHFNVANYYEIYSTNYLQTAVKDQLVNVDVS